MIHDQILVSAATAVGQQPPVGRSWIQQVELSRHLLLAERFTLRKISSNGP